VHHGGCRFARLFESESGTHQVGLVLVPEVCAGRYGGGRVRARCERDEEGIVGEFSHGALLRSNVLSCAPVTLESGPQPSDRFRRKNRFPHSRQCQGNQPASRRRKSLTLCRTDRRQYVDPHAGQLTALACARGLTPWRMKCWVAIIVWWVDETIHHTPIGRPA
jgi:hypothetical protein